MLALRIVNGNANRAETTVAHLVRWIVAHDVLRAQVMRYLARYFRQIRERVGEECASSCFARKTVDERDCAVARTLSDESAFTIKLIHKAYDKNLHILFAQRLKEPVLIVEAFAVFA